MRLIFILLTLISQASVIASTFEGQREDSESSERFSVERLECMSMKAFDGEYAYISAGSEQVCGLYLIAKPDQVIEVEFEEFAIGCENEGLLAVLDGWELNGQYFPAPEDHENSFEERYRQFCGAHGRPRERFISKQNVALLQFRIPDAGQGFVISVKFIFNPEPCNIIAPLQEGEFTLSNYGKERNCSFAMINPEVVAVTMLDVGVSTNNLMTRTRTRSTTGLSNSCSNSRGADFVELLSGNGLDIALIPRRLYFCGKDQTKDGVDVHGIVLGCQSSVVRLVSSGLYTNAITFFYSAPTTDDYMNQVC